MKYTIYKTINLINNKFYIGYHKTENPNDEYLGSGKLLIKAIKKHGRENFKKFVLFEFDTKEEAFKMEKILVNESVVKDKNSYNCKIGGEGGWDHIFIRLKNDPEYKKIFSERCSKSTLTAIERGTHSSWPKNLWLGKTHTEEARKNMSKSKKEFDANFKRERIKDYYSVKEDKNMFSILSNKWNITVENVKIYLRKYDLIDSHSSYSGKLNSQYGKCWIYSEELKESKRVLKTEVDQYLKDNPLWKKGRKQKFN